MSKEYTREEVKLQFQQHIANLVDYWENETLVQTSKEKLEGLAFTFCSMLDGSAFPLPAFHVIPFGTEEDKQYSIEEGTDYYPVSNLDDHPMDIAGGLHETLHQVFNQ